MHEGGLKGGQPSLGCVSDCDERARRCAAARPTAAQRKTRLRHDKQTEGVSWHTKHPLWLPGLTTRAVCTSGLFVHTVNTSCRQAGVCCSEQHTTCFENSPMHCWMNKCTSLAFFFFVLAFLFYTKREKAEADTQNPKWWLICSMKSSRNKNRKTNHPGRESPDSERPEVVRLAQVPTFEASHWTVKQHLGQTVTDLIYKMENTRPAAHLWFMILFFPTRCLSHCCSRTRKRTEVPGWLAERSPLPAGDLSRERVSDMTLQTVRCMTTGWNHRWGLSSPATDWRLNRMRQEVPEEYRISNRDHAQLVRGEGYLVDGLTVADEHLHTANRVFKVNMF